MLARQFTAFFGAGVLAAIVHYGVLIGLVERAGWSPVWAALAGYMAGGIVSYLANRRFTFESARAHRESAWRFALVAATGFLLTAAAMALLVDGLRLPYLPAQVATTGVVLMWSFAAHKFWTFRGTLPP